MPDNGTHKGDRSVTIAGLLVGPATLMVVFMMLAPLLMIFGLSFSQFDALQLSVDGATLRHFWRFFLDPYYLSVLGTTILIAVACTFLCLLVGFPIAYRLARMRGRWKSALVIMLILPLFISGTNRTIGWMVLFTKNGLVNQTLAKLSPGLELDIMYTPLAVTIGSVSILLPFMVLTLQNVIESINLQFEEAAQGLGAPDFVVFSRIVWPLAAPGTTIGCILCFTMSMNTYATAVLLGGPQFHMMAPLVYYDFTVGNNWPMASVAASILLIVNLLMALFLTRFIGRRPRRGSASRPTAPLQKT